MRDKTSILPRKKKRIWLGHIGPVRTWERGIPLSLSFSPQSTPVTCHFGHCFRRTTLVKACISLLQPCLSLPFSPSFLIFLSLSLTHDLSLSPSTVSYDLPLSKRHQNARAAPMSFPCRWTSTPTTSAWDDSWHVQNGVHELTDSWAFQRVFSTAIYLLQQPTITGYWDQAQLQDHAHQMKCNFFGDP